MPLARSSAATATVAVFAALAGLAWARRRARARRRLSLPRSHPRRFVDALNRRREEIDAGIVDPADRPGGLRYGQYEILRVEIPLWLRPTARAFAGGIGCRGRVPTALLKNTCADKLHDREHARPCAATWIKWHPRGQARCVSRGGRERARRALRARTVSPDIYIIGRARARVLDLGSSSRACATRRTRRRGCRPT